MKPELERAGLFHTWSTNQENQSSVEPTVEITEKIAQCHSSRASQLINQYALLPVSAFKHSSQNISNEIIIYCFKAIQH